MANENTQQIVNIAENQITSKNRSIFESNSLFLQAIRKAEYLANSDIIPKDFQKKPPTS